MKERQEDQDIWIDFLEGEVDPSLREDLARMLQNKPAAQAAVNDYARIKKGVKKTNDIKLNLDDQYFENLHSKIMTAVETQTAPKEAEVIPLIRRRWVPVAAAAALVIVLGGVFVNHVKDLQGQKPADKVARVSQDWLIQTSAKNPGAFSETVISNEDDSDLLMDATARKLDRMSDDEAKKIINELIR